MKILIIVVAIPEGLPLAVTLTLQFSITKMIEDQNLVRRMESCETMGGANYICTDKTGTLTMNEMNIVRIYDGARIIDASSLSQKDKKGKPSDFFTPEIYELLKLNSACNTSTEVINYVNISFLILVRKLLHLKLIWLSLKSLRYSERTSPN
jgi:magnesium-transporting ATPase (P-type)